MEVAASHSMYTANPGRQSVWAAKTKYCRRSSLQNHRNFFLTALEVDSLRSEYQHGQVTVLFQVTDFLYPHTGGG